MFDILRSEKLSFFQIFMDASAAYTYVREFGKMGQLQFVDLNQNMIGFQRKFYKTVIWCQEMERLLNFFYRELELEGVKPHPCDGKAVAAPDQSKFNQIENEIRQNNSLLIESNKNMHTIKTNHYSSVQYYKLIEIVEAFLIQNPDIVMSGAGGPLELDNLRTSNLHIITGTTERKNCSFLEQVVWRTTKGNAYVRFFDLEMSVADPEKKVPVDRSVFILMVHGATLKNKITRICETLNTRIFDFPSSSAERASVSERLKAKVIEMESIIQKSTQSRQNTLDQIASNINLRFAQVVKIKTIYETMNMFSYDKGTNGLVAEAWIPAEYSSQVRETISMIDSQKPTGTAVFSHVETDDTPPTYFKSNKFVKGFQNIVNAYGVPKYKEINPALFTIITFPFFFSIMFSDLGHAIMLTAFGLFMVLKEKLVLKYKKNEMFGIIISGRYIILLMGLFSIYSGFIFNDIWSRSFNIYGSMWRLPDNVDRGPGVITYSQLRDLALSSPNEIVDMPVSQFVRNYPYPVGFDPMWALGDNLIAVTNSFKMKLSVILGVVHMSGGIFLSLLNHIYFKDYASIVLEFIPQVIFFWSIFGYLVFLIFYKWITVNSTSENQASLLLTLIGMFLNFGKTIAPEDRFYKHQEEVQMFLVIIAVVCVPIMLLGKPLYKIYKHKKRRSIPLIYKKDSDLHHGSSTHHVYNKGGIAMCDPPSNGSNKKCNGGLVNSHQQHEMHEVAVMIQNTNEDHPHRLTGDESVVQVHSADDNGNYNLIKHSSTSSKETKHVGFERGHDEPVIIRRKKQEEPEQLPIGEIMTLQAIHTIEFVLGSVSNTASYLRLWALGLAHTQLSEVLWTMLLRLALSTNGLGAGAIVIFFIFFVFILLTIAVLIIMEGLSAFLHALRLHWVEFQNKFYAGSGVLFSPFKLNAALDARK